MKPGARLTAEIGGDLQSRMIAHLHRAWCHTRKLLAVLFRMRQVSANKDILMPPAVSVNTEQLTQRRRPHTGGPNNGGSFYGGFFGDYLIRTNIQDLRRVRISTPMLCSCRAALCDNSSGYSQFNTCRSAADDDEIERVVRASQLKSQQHPPPDLERIFNSLESGGKLLPLIVAEIRVRSTGSQNQIVERKCVMFLQSTSLLVRSKPVTSSSNTLTFL